MQSSGFYQTQSNLSIASTLTSDTGAYYCKAILQVDGLTQPVIVRVDEDINVMVQGEYRVPMLLYIDTMIHVSKL